MSDLRTRIAYAIAQADGDEPGMEPAACDYEMADAVIAELGLTKEDEYNPYNPFPPPYRVRYVTEWKAEDEKSDYCVRCGIPHAGECKRKKGT
jgi:hypothetical protein